MTNEVFQKLITLSCGLDMVSDTERQDMVHQISDMVIQSVALRAVQTVSQDQIEPLYHRIHTTTATNQVSLSELFPDLDIWIQDEVRAIAGQIEV